jgi:hypothetical protein
MKHLQCVRRKTVLFLFFLVFLLLPSSKNLFAAGETRSIVFPILGSASYYDDFGAPRVGHSHEGNDMFAPKMRPLVAAVDGIINWVQYPQPDWGYAISIRDSEGFSYWYLHVNNDNPGTDDGLGDGLHAYGVDIINGAPVVKGQLIGWVGDSGNAETTSAHLHFEIHDQNGTPYSPYLSLKSATHLSTPVDYPKLPYEILPYGNFKGGASIAAGNFGGGATLVTGAGAGGGPHVKIMNSEGVVINQFFPYPSAFKGGVNVAAGDINGDGIDEIITGAGAGGTPHVRIISATGIPMGSFFAYPMAFKGGVQVTAGDIDGDGKAEIITGAGPGGTPHVRVFKADGTPISGFFPYALTFKGGVNVAVKPANSSGPAKIVTSPGIGGGPHIRTFDMSGNPEASFFAYDQAFRGGVKVAVMNSSDAYNNFSIVTVPASKGGPDIRIFSSLGTLTESQKAYEPWWRGGYTISTLNNTVYIVGDGRRASIRTIGGSYQSGYNNNGGNNDNNNPWRGRRRWGD